MCCTLLFLRYGWELSGFGHLLYYYTQILLFLWPTLTDDTSVMNAALLYYLLINRMRPSEHTAGSIFTTPSKHVKAVRTHRFITIFTSGNHCPELVGYSPHCQISLLYGR